MSINEALKYPSNFPPTDRWKRFFIGVRWLGPDLSFLEQLHATQGARNSEAMNSWGGGNRQQVAVDISSILAKRMGWPSPYFLPDDNFGVVASGPKFGVTDDVDIRSAIGEVEERLGIKPDPAFWHDTATGTLGELVDNLLRMKSGA